MSELSVEEEKWLDALRGLPLWEPALVPTLIISPHPDDETLGCGGLIAALRAHGVPVTVAAVTDGENAYAGVSGLGPKRRVEQVQALTRLGVSGDQICRFEFPDGRVTEHEEELMRRLQPLVANGMQVVAPWRGDRHPDHEACGRAAERVTEQKSARLISYFFWTWHWGQLGSLAGLPMKRFALTPELLAAKSAALACHRSQLKREGGDPVLPEQLLAPARRNFEAFAIA